MKQLPHITWLAAAVTLFSWSCLQQEAPTTPQPPVHPGFTLTSDDIMEMAADYPESIRRRMAERPEYFMELMGNLLDLPEDTLILVDKQHSLEPEFAPPDLVSLDDYALTVSREGLSLRASTMPDVLAMVEAARQEGIELVFSSTYRSYFYQAGVYTRNVEQLGREAADRESAQPGHSQHQLGTCVDFGSITDAFAATPAGIWLRKHAGEYGFSLSYPDGYEDLTGYRYESWHYRHITRTACLAEAQFFEGIQHYLLTFIHNNSDALRAARVATQASNSEE